ncbi:hypothetical protein ANO14919_086380 [Xylariales sp. No.14919]|nr:hypothetical protein ANO14919_086380 [Xylariales sp. No.14919]
MRLPLVALALALSFAIVTGAQNFSSYVPECVPPCVEQTVNHTKVCPDLSDNECLCANSSQIILPSRFCFIQNCNSTNPIELRSEITSRWEEFCNDSGIPVDLSTNWDPTPTSSPTSSVTSSVLSTSSSTASSDSIPALASGLSTGAKAGIGVGAGVGSLAVIGGLVFLGFRLGRRKRRESKVVAGSMPPFNGAVHPGNGQSTTLPDTTTTWTAAEGGGDNWTYKPQPALAELSSPSSPHSGPLAHELPVNEYPAELYGAMPPELSADGEIPRTASAGRL